MKTGSTEILFKMEDRRIGMGVLVKTTKHGWLEIRATSLADEQFPDGPTMYLRPDSVVRARCTETPSV